MTEKDLFREIGMINEKYVEEAAQVKKAKILTPAFLRTLATAACLCICVGIYFGTRGLREDLAANESAADMNIATNDATNQAGESFESALSQSVDKEATVESSTNGNLWENLLDGFTGKEESATQGSQSVMQDSASLDDFMDSEGVAETPKEECEEVGEQAAARKELEDYSNDYEELCNGDAFVVTHGKVTAGYDKWEAFLYGFECGEIVQLDVIRFTVEGDAIITRVWCENGVFHIIEDSTRDAWGVGGYAEYTFESINVIKNSDGMVQVVFADIGIQDLATVDPEETPMYFLVECQEPIE